MNAECRSISVLHARIKGSSSFGEDRIPPHISPWYTSINFLSFFFTEVQIKILIHLSTYRTPYLNTNTIPHSASHLPSSTSNGTPTPSKQIKNDNPPKGTRFPTTPNIQNKPFQPTRRAVQSPSPNLQRQNALSNQHIRRRDPQPLTKHPNKTHPLARTSLPPQTVHRRRNRRDPWYQPGNGNLTVPPNQSKRGAGSINGLHKRRGTNAGRTMDTNGAFPNLRLGNGSTTRPDRAT